MAEGHPPAAAMAIRASYRRSRLPFARPQTLQTLQRSPQLRREKVPQQAQQPPLPHAKATTRPQQWLKGTPTRATPAGKSHHKATAMAPGHPPAAAMASYRCARLPFARPQTSSNPPNPPKVRPAPQGKGTPTSPARATPARKSHHKATAMAEGHPPATAMAQGHPPAAAMASYRCSRLPFARPQTLQKTAQLRREKVPQQAQHAPRPQAKATTRPQQWLKGTPRPQQWLKGTPRPQQWLLIGAQGCRLPGLNPSKSPPSSAGKRYPNKPNTRYSRTQMPPQGHNNG